MSYSSETERFYLRPFQLSDKEDLFELDSDSEVHKYLGNNPVTEINQVIVYIEDVLKQYQDSGLGRWIIEDKSTGEALGWCGIKLEKNLRSFEYYDLGYRIKRKHWRKGIATETAKEALRYGFQELKLKKIAAAADALNEGSNKILSSLGMKRGANFVFDGTLCHWYEIKNDDY